MPRPVTVLAAGGTIAMAGGRAVPALDAAALVAAVPELAAVEGLEATTVCNLPGPQITGSEALRIARTAARTATAGRGVVVTHGTDTLEETAALCAFLHGAEAPVVFTGAIRPASATGADGPANLADALAAAAAPETAGAGVLVAFAGELHAALAVRKVDSTSPAAFASSHIGPVGRVAEGRVELLGTMRDVPVLDVAHLDARVPIVPTWLGDDGALLHAAAAQADGVVVVALGAGHVPPPFLAALRDVAGRIPVVVTVRPERGAIVHATYGFEGAEGDVRASGAICAGALAPPAARMALLACLGAGLGPAAIRDALVRFDR